MVQVNSSSVANSINVRSSTSGSVVTAGTPSYYYVLARDWAVSPNLVENADYSSKYYANKSKEYCFTILNDAGFIAVSENLTIINAVAEDLDNINAVVLNKTNIDKVADNETNINAAAVNEANINAAVANETNINAAVANETNINLVANDKTNIDIVAAAKTNIDTNATYINNINTTAQYISNINTVSNYVTQIDTIDNYVSAINTCSTYISDINICATSISSITSKVNKSGDTMTGILTFEQGGAITLKGDYSSSTNYGSTPPIDFSLTGHNNMPGRIMGFNQNGVKKISLYVGGATEDDLVIEFTKNTNTNPNIYGFSLKSEIIHSITNWAFPSSTYYDETLPANDTVYTNTHGNGWLIFSMFAGAAGEYLQLNAFDGALTNKNNMIAGDAAISSGHLCYASLYMAQGQQAKVYYNTTGSLLMFRFVLAKGG